MTKMPVYLAEEKYTCTDLVVSLKQKLLEVYFKNCVVFFFP